MTLLHLYNQRAKKSLAFIGYNNKSMGIMEYKIEIIFKICVKILNLKKCLLKQFSILISFCTKCVVFNIHLIKHKNKTIKNNE